MYIYIYSRVPTIHSAWLSLLVTFVHMHYNSMRLHIMSVDYVYICAKNQVENLKLAQKPWETQKFNKRIYIFCIAFFAIALNNLSWFFLLLLLLFRFNITQTVIVLLALFFYMPLLFALAAAVALFSCIYQSVHMWPNVHKYLSNGPKKNMATENENAGWKKKCI